MTAWRGPGPEPDGLDFVRGLIAATNRMFLPGHSAVVQKPIDHKVVRVRVEHEGRHGIFAISLFDIKDLDRKGITRVTLLKLDDAITSLRPVAKAGDAP